MARPPGGSSTTLVAGEMSFPKGKPPHSVKVLHSWIAVYAKETGQLPERVMRSVSYMIISIALDRARDDAGTVLFPIKGGVMIELRAGLRARATRDLDVVFQADFRAWLDRLDQAIRMPVGDFTITRTEPGRVGQTSTQRLQLLIDYRGRRWAQTPLEIAPVESPEVLEVEHVKPLRISQLGLPEPESVAVVGIRYQIAQKLHACTEKFRTGPENDRFRDLMDLLLLRDLLGRDDLPRVREACVRIFEARDKQPWPPMVTVYESWRAAYREMAREEGFGVRDVDDAALLVTEMIAQIDAAV
ncbi:MAG TPA: nucleotidyl transferase AbiEii/AbiGii toxin family protein [Solirubrobacteraceae bacterium]|nr:nucleotidyl transferase AbiEii/AbiGii toxin family protein [Solirubrobacteraceae bacterium]